MPNQVRTVRNEKEPLFESMVQPSSHLLLLLKQSRASSIQVSSSKRFVLTLTLLLLLHWTSRAECASVSTSTNNNNNNNDNNRNSHSNSNNENQTPTGNYRFLDRQNEFDGGVTFLDDDTLRLSLAIDDESSSSGLSAPSLHILEPKVFLRVSGESGMIRPETNHRKNEVLQSNVRALREKKKRPKSNLQFHRESIPNRDEVEEEDQGDHVEEEEDDDDDEEEMNDNYHHHFPYIESYREKYVRPDPSQFEVTTPRTTTSNKSSRQEWSDIIAQVTTPSSFNEINSSASEHRLADFHIRANLPTYFYSKYLPYSEEDLENVADLDGEHSKYFVKTRPRSVTAAGTNIYSNFYYEPPSFSTKSVPIPVKTNKDKVVFASAKPTQSPHNHHQQQQHRFNEHEEEIIHYHHHHVHDHNNEELPPQDSPVMTTIPSNFTERSRSVPNQTPPQVMYRVKEDKISSKESVLKTSASLGSNQNQNLNDYFKIEGNLKTSASNNADDNIRHHVYLKSSAETLDVSTSQSILSKVTVNNPHLHHHHPQFIIIKSDPHFVKTAAEVRLGSAATPRNNQNQDEITLTSIKIASGEEENHNDHHDQQQQQQQQQQQNQDSDDESDSITNPVPTTTELPSPTESSTTTTPTSIPTTTTTDATSIPGIPGVDYPTLGEIPQTSFDCKNQRYKGFFADIDTKCQAWHYCDFTDSHSTFLCPNGTLFSQVLLTCDWWFNVDCNQARQLYVLNERLYRYIKPPKPSFPEDFVGEHVDKWLLQQFTDGFLPKVRKKSKAKFVNLPPPTSTEPPTTQKEN